MLQFFVMQGKLPYISLFNKYRPKSFSDIIGQSVVVRIISNSIRYDKLASLVILSGHYGVGKTTIARIIVRMLNCENPDLKNYDPCFKCVSCKAMDSAMNPDVLEIDAASNNGVESIKEIIENARYMPIISRYKIYIIDEVHMLSRSAFNAFLKTLEEAPAHVKFIMATTEIAKVPQTIVSRSQCFNFRPLSVEKIESLLEKIAISEGYEYEQDALLLIARSSLGAVRDAISMLEQAYLLNNNKIMLSDVKEMLGMVFDDEIEQIVKYILYNDPKHALLNFKFLCNKGLRHEQFFNKCLEFLHFQVVHHVDSHHINEDVLNIDNVMIEKIYRVWNCIIKYVGVIKSINNKFQAIEMLIIKLCYICSLPSPNEILEKISINDTPSVNEDANVNIIKRNMDKGVVEKKVLYRSNGNSVDDNYNLIVDQVEKKNDNSCSKFSGEIIDAIKKEFNEVNFREMGD